MSISYKWCGVFVAAALAIGLTVADCRAGGEGIAPKDVVIQGRRPLAKTVDMVYRDSQWRLDLYLNNKGTRSQGSMGRLYFNGEFVQGKAGEIRDTGIGKIRYNGPEGFRKNLWDATGWQMLEPKVTPEVHEGNFDIPGHRIPGKNMTELAKELEQMTGNN